MYYKREFGKLNVFDKDGNILISRKKVSKCRLHNKLICLKIVGLGREGWSVYTLKGILLFKKHHFYWLQDDFIVFKTKDADYFSVKTYDGEHITCYAIIFDEEGFIYEDGTSALRSVTIKEFRQGKKGKLLKLKR